MSVFPFKKQSKDRKEILYIRPSAWKNPFSRLKTKYEIINGTTLNINSGWVEGGNELEIADISRYKVDPGLIKWLFGCKDIIFATNTSNSDNPYRWKNVPDAVRVKDFIQSLKTNKEPFEIAFNGEKRSESVSTSKTRPIPEGVRFSDNVLIMPLAAYFLERPLWVNNHCREFIYSKNEPGTYNWVEKGDALFSFGVNLPFGKRQVINIESPVNGIVLKANIGCHPGTFGDEENKLWRSLTILLPEGERPTIEASETYRELYALCRKYHYWVFKEEKLSFKGLIGMPNRNPEHEREMLEWFEKSIVKTPSKYGFAAIKDDFQFMELYDDLLEKNPDIQDKLSLKNTKKIRFDLALSEYDKELFASAAFYFNTALPDFTHPKKHANALFHEGLEKIRFSEDSNYNSDLKNRYDIEANELIRKAAELDPSHVGACEKLGIEPKERGYDNKESDFSKGKEQRKEEDEADYSNYLAEIIARWKLPPIFSLNILNKQYAEFLENKNYPIEQIDEEYLILKSFAA